MDSLKVFGLSAEKLPQKCWTLTQPCCNDHKQVTVILILITVQIYFGLLGARLLECNVSVTVQYKHGKSGYAEIY